MTQSLVESANAILAGEKVETFHEMALNEEVEFFIEELNEDQFLELQALEELGEQWELTEEDYVEAIRCIYEAEREGGLVGFAKKHFSKSGRLQKKIDKQTKSAEKSQARVDKKADIADKQKQLGVAKAKADAARKADTGTSKTKGQIVKQKARIAGKKVVKGIKQGVKNFVFGKKKPADKSASSQPPEKKVAPAPAEPKKDTPPPEKKDTPPPEKKKDDGFKKVGAGKVRKVFNSTDHWKQWQHTGIQDSHDISVYYDVLAGKTVGEARKVKKGKPSQKEIDKVNDKLSKL